MNIKQLKEYINDLPDDMEILRDRWEWEWDWCFSIYWYEIVNPEVIEARIKNTDYLHRVGTTYEFKENNWELIKALYV